MPQAVAAIACTNPHATIEVWSEDEHRIGLKPILRRVWAPKGQRPNLTVQHRYVWSYLYGFVCPQSGESFWLLLPRVSIEAWNRALKEFAQAMKLGPNKQVVLVLDQAGWHRSQKVVVPDGLHVVFLPPYSPELQPAERLWSLSDEAIANKHFADIDELMEAQTQRCRSLVDLPDIVRASTFFHWWPTTPSCH